ncbi:MAG: M48 family metallopeptidase [Gammaproteobacteria bacterium]|nr:M48 family metallopeptidase [Gammaproteobacteria bacterium]
MYVKNIYLLALLSTVMFILSSCTVPLVSEREIEIESEKNFDEMKMANAPSTEVSQRNYVVCVARAIIEQTEEPYRSLDWEIVVFDDDQQIQAFAMAGGKIGVFTGLLQLTENQHQLATVLGHEVAHVTQQHMYERINREATTQIGASAVGAVLGGGAAGDLVQMGAQLGISLPYGRGEESESDRVGLAYMSAAGFDPRESVSLWKNMAKESKGAPPEFLSTHPSSSSRIDDLIGELGGALVSYNAAVSAGKNPQCEQ